LSHISKFVDQVVAKINSGSSIIWVYLTGDSGRCERILPKICERYGAMNRQAMALHQWDVVNGTTWHGKSPIMDPTDALKSVPAINGDSLVLMRDFAAFLNGSGTANLTLRRVLINLCNGVSLSNTNNARALLIMSSTPTPHEDIAEFCDVVDFDLPTFDEMATDAVDFIETSRQEAAAAAGKTLPACEGELKDKITRSLLGTSSAEAQRILAYAVSSGGMSPGVLDVIAKEKAKVVRKVEGLEFIPWERITPEEQIGGFTALRKWLKIRGRAYSRHAQALGMELPRGIVLIGPPGTGKTMVAKATAKILGLDLITLDIGSMYDKYVGGSEGKIRKALNMVKAMPNALLLVD